MKELENYINQEKKIEPSPFLKEKILSAAYLHAEDNAEATAPRRLTLWQSITVAASIVIIISLGITLGSNYHTKRHIAINDNYIENLELFTTEGNSSTLINR